MFGLLDAIIKQINSIFAKYTVIDKVIVYGSRAKGNYTNGSDIDLTIYGDDHTQMTLLHIMTELDDLLLPL